MPLVQRFKSIWSEMNASNIPFATQVQGWLAENPGIMIQDVDCSRPNSTYNADAQFIRIAYLECQAPAVGATYAAALYQNVNGVSAQDAFNAAYADGLSVVPHFILDITDHEQNKTDAESLLVIGVVTDLSPLGEVGTDRATFIAQPIGDIAGGAIGNAALYDASGRVVAGSIPILNVGDVAWVANQRNYAIWDMESGMYIGLPSCCGAGALVVATTTTTTYPCVPVFTS